MADRFATAILDWFDRHGRHDLPWQTDRSAYRVWVSEIMLQQTQVATVIPFFERFIARFPTVLALADAALDDVLHHWSGLGYYARARNLHRAAQIVRDEHGGKLPDAVDSLMRLPGIGRSTAGAIASIAFDARAPILDGNVKRVLARFHAIDGYPGERKVESALWELAEQHTPSRRTPDYTQAIMDLGATVCTRNTPVCGACPVAADCEASKRGIAYRLPAPRPKIDRPHRNATVFLLIDPGGATWLERRADQGIWGGLWSPPQREPDVPATNVLDDYGISENDVARISTAPPLRHGFTHFSLDVTPVYVWLLRRPECLQDTDGRGWYAAGSGQTLGLSAIAARLLRSVEALTQGDLLAMDDQR